MHDLGIVVRSKHDRNNLNSRVVTRFLYARKVTLIREVELTKKLVLYFR